MADTDQIAIDATTIVAVLEDATSSRLPDALESPKSAKELSEVCEIPISTTYRKLARLERISLSEERTDSSVTSRHPSCYPPAFDSIDLRFTASQGMSIKISHGAERTEPAET